MRYWFAAVSVLFFAACGGSDPNRKTPPPSTMPPATSTSGNNGPSRVDDPPHFETRQPSRFDFQNRDLVFGESFVIGQSYLGQSFGFHCYVGDQVAEVAPKFPIYRFEARFDRRNRTLRVRIYALQIAKTVALKAIRLREEYARLEDLRENQRRERCGRSVVEQIHFGDSVIYTGEYRIPANRRGVEFAKTYSDSPEDLDKLRKSFESLQKTYRRSRSSIEKNRPDLNFEPSDADLVTRLSGYLKSAAENPLKEHDLFPIKLVQIGIAPSYP